MQEDRQDQRSSPPALPLPLVTEALRSAAAAGVSPPQAKGEERISVFWRIFGGTLLSIAALAVISICQYFNSSLNELRSDLGHEHNQVQKELAHLSEAQADLMKKDEFNYRMKSVWDGLKAVQTDLTTVAGLKERAGMMEQQLKVEGAERKELLREFQRLREIQATQDERKELVRELQLLRERLAALEGRQTASSPVKAAVHKEE